MNTIRIVVHTSVCTQKDNAMFLQEFAISQILREPRKVCKAAYRKPILITRQRDEGLVMMSKKEYAKLVKASGGK